MRLVAVALLACACACKDDKPKPAPTPPTPAPPIDAAVVLDWTAPCAEALAAKLTPVRALSAIIEHCQPCGDWKPLLAWNLMPDQGGPTEAAIREAMDRCKAFCSKDSQTTFNGLLSETRGGGSNKPWRTLGDKCGAAVSAVPDVRFMSAPYFALDRIARAAAADPKLGPLIASLELPLPALSLSGVGFELPTAAVMKPEPGKFHVTVTAKELRIGTLPSAKLTADGVVVDHGATPYPGELVAPKDLRGKLDALAPGQRVVLIAPTALPASRVLEVVKVAGDRELVLAVAATGAPPPWTLPGIVPLALTNARRDDAYTWALDARVDAAIANLKAKPEAAFDHPRIKIGKDATVAHLAKLLGALAFRDAKAASLTP